MFDIKSSINRYFDQLLITYILSSKDIRNDDMEEIDEAYFEVKQEIEKAIDSYIDRLEQEI